MADDWMDVSVPLHTGMVHWPDNPPVLLERVLDIEGLNLSRIAPGIYELICLPLKIEGGDGAPSRALLRSVEATASEEEGKILCL